MKCRRLAVSPSSGFSVVLGRVLAGELDGRPCRAELPRVCASAVDRRYLSALAARVPFLGRLVTSGAIWKVIESP